MASNTVGNFFFLCMSLPQTPVMASNCVWGECPLYEGDGPVSRGEGKNSSWVSHSTQNDKTTVKIEFLESTWVYTFWLSKIFITATEHCITFCSKKWPRNGAVTHHELIVSSELVFKQSESKVNGFASQRPLFGTHKTYRKVSKKLPILCQVRAALKKMVSRFELVWVKHPQFKENHGDWKVPVCLEPHSFRELHYLGVDLRVENRYQSYHPSLAFSSL